jgi:hypothetical protein
MELESSEEFTPRIEEVVGVDSEEVEGDEGAEFSDVGSSCLNCGKGAFPEVWLVVTAGVAATLLRFEGARVGVLPVQCEARR